MSNFIEMNLDTIIQLALSSAIFSFPRQFPMELYTRVRRLFKGKRKGPETEFSDPALESTDPEEAQLANHFRKACKAVESSSALSNKHLITFYGLYKQATIGNCNREKPSESSVADFMKWYRLKQALLNILGRNGWRDWECPKLKRRESMLDLLKSGYHILRNLFKVR